MYRLKLVAWLFLVALLSIGILAVAQEKKKEVKTPAAELAVKVSYTCPMHPEVVSSEPGTCPKCGMKLRQVSSDAQTAKKDSATVSKKGVEKACAGSCSGCCGGAH